MTASATLDGTHKDDAVNVVTAVTGATIKPGPMVTAPPAAIATDEQLAEIAGDSGLNGPFLADLLSAAIAHERMGVNLFRTLGSLSQNPALISKYGQLAEESMQASKRWAELITTLGGSPQYASPPARLTETTDQKMIEALLGTGSADPLSIEMAGVQSTLAAATLCVAFADIVEALGREASGASATALQAAANQLRPMAAAHVEWATKQLATMALTLAKHPMAQKLGQAAETMVGKVKDALH